jgi:hypothetical protein
MWWDMNETISSRATFVQARMVQLPSGEQITTDKAGRIGEMVEVEVKRTGIQYAMVLKTLDTVISSSENRSKSTSTVLSGRLDDRIDLIGGLGQEYDNCVIVEFPDAIITNFTFKDYTNTTLLTTFIAGTSAVYLNGLRQKLGTDYTENPATGKILFSVAPNAGDLIVIKVRKAYLP